MTLRDLKWEIRDLNNEVDEYKAIIRAMEKMEKIQSREIRSKDGELFDLKNHIGRLNDELGKLRRRQCETCNPGAWFSGDR